MRIFTIAGLLNSENSSATKIVMRLSFGVVLSLVLFKGAELFTGNNFVMIIGSLTKLVSLLNIVKVWIVSFIGNLVGSIITGIMCFLVGLVVGQCGSL